VENSPEPEKPDEVKSALSSKGYGHDDSVLTGPDVKEDDPFAGRDFFFEKSETPQKAGNKLFAEKPAVEESP